MVIQTNIGEVKCNNLRDDFVFYYLVVITYASMKSNINYTMAFLSMHFAKIVSTIPCGT